MYRRLFSDSKRVPGPAIISCLFLLLLLLLLFIFPLLLLLPLLHGDPTADRRRIIGGKREKKTLHRVGALSLSLSLSLGAVESLTKQHIICMTIKKDTADNNDRQRRRRAPPARHDETSENSRRNKRIMNGIDTHTHAHTHTLADDGTNLQEFFSFSEPNNFYNALRRCCAIN